MEFGYGTKGYFNKNVTTDTYLPYSPWAIPAGIAQKRGYIVTAANSPVEWSLIQSNTETNPQYFRSVYTTIRRSAYVKISLTGTTVDRVSSQAPCRSWVEPQAERRVGVALGG